ncbi:hypothetical protein [Streptomyces sp. NPDC001070]
MRLHRLTLTAFGPFAGTHAAGRRRGNRLRGDHAGPDTLTGVVVDLTVGGRQPEITRCPGKPGTGPDTAERAVLRDAFDAVRSDAARAETD